MQKFSGLLRSQMVVGFFSLLTDLIIYARYFKDVGEKASIIQEGLRFLLRLRKCSTKFATKYVSTSTSTSTITICKFLFQFVNENQKWVLVYFLRLQFLIGNVIYFEEQSLWKAIIIINQNFYDVAPSTEENVKRRMGRR